MGHSAVATVARLLGEREQRVWRRDPWVTKASRDVPEYARRAARGTLRMLVDSDPTCLEEDPLAVLTTLPCFDGQARMGSGVEAGHVLDGSSSSGLMLVTDRSLRVAAISDSRARDRRFLRQLRWTVDEVRTARLHVRLFARFCRTDADGYQWLAEWRWSEHDPEDLDLATTYLSFPDVPFRPWCQKHLGSGSLPDDMRRDIVQTVARGEEIQPDPALQHLHAAIQALCVHDGETQATAVDCPDRRPVAPDVTGQAAELAAVAMLRDYGFGDVRRTSDGDDEGVDVVADGIIAGVRDRRGARESREELQKLWGIACLSGHPRVAYFSTGGFTGPARQWADRAGIALFDVDEDRCFRPVNESAWALKLQLDADSRSGPARRQ